MKKLSSAQINARKRFLLHGMLANIKLLQKGASADVTKSLQDAYWEVQFAINALEKEAL